MEPTYLGDGLYATCEGGTIEIFAHDGCSKTNQVWMDESVLKRFEEFVAKLRAGKK